MREKLKVVFVYIAAMLVPIGIRAADPEVRPGDQVSQSFQKEVRYPLSSRYLLYLPKEYEETDQRWPLLLFLHGNGERGHDLARVKAQGPAKLIEEGRDFPLIIVSPQLGDPIAWSASDLAALIDEIVSTYSVDEDRIYVTGMSMGGFGAWSLILDDPDRFAAVAPIAGGGASWQACRAKNVAAWIFHGARDEVVPVEYSRVMARELKKCGGKVRYTEYPDLNHDSWTTTYDNPDLYDWLLEQRR